MSFPSLHPSLHPIDVKIGLQNSSYTVEEGDKAIPVCADIIDGCLGCDVWVQYSTFSESAEGTHHEL